MSEDESNQPRIPGWVMHIITGLVTIAISFGGYMYREGGKEQRLIQLEADDTTNKSYKHVSEGDVKSMVETTGPYISDRGTIQQSLQQLREQQAVLGASLTEVRKDMQESTIRQARQDTKLDIVLSELQSIHKELKPEKP